MTQVTKSRDVSNIPTYAYGAKNPLWWGTQAFMIIEGLGFVFAVATYLYLYNQNKTWPLGGQPPLRWSTVITILMIVSEVPNIWLKKLAKEPNLNKVRLGLIIMSIIGIACLVLRVFEFKILNINWDTNAYGSIVWFLLGLHTFHLITDVAETLVMTVCIFLGPVDMRRFPEIEDNQDYWHFVVFFWLVVYVTIYWLPRWMEVSP
jgi:cytochrome c oxidase subunit 3